MFLIFRTTPLVMRCMAAVPLVATALYFFQANPWFSINWFNLAKMAWAVEQTPTLRQHNLPMVFVSWLANLQHKIKWTSSETSVVSSRWILNNWAFFSLLRNCFNKSEIWRHLRLVVLINSGIFLTLETFFFLHWNGFFSSIDNDFLEMLQRMPLIYFDECRKLWPHTFLRRPGAEWLLSNRLYKIGNALKDMGSAFLILCDKTHTRCRYKPFFLE